MASPDHPRPATRSFQPRSVTAVSVTDHALVQEGSSPTTLPACFTPAAGPVDLPAWLAANREAVRPRLHQAGAILLRGFGVTTVDAFDDAARSYSADLLDYYERSTPRRSVAGKIYSSTDYPPDRQIPLHPESAYSHYWPRILWFCCLTAAQSGGATPLADNRVIASRLPPATRQRFADRGVRYIRNYYENFDIPWQVAFQSGDRPVVEEYCRRSGMTWEWRDDGGLRTTHALDAEVVHPDTGERVWFNQVHAWHLSSLDPRDQAAMRAMFGTDGLPRHVTFGDGTPIGEDDLRAVSAAHAAASVSFPWQAGDVLLIDNMLVSHGRQPFAGPRTVVVAMSGPFDRSRLAR